MPNLIEINQENSTGDKYKHSNSARNTSKSQKGPIYKKCTCKCPYKQDFFLNQAKTHFFQQIST